MDRLQKRLSKLGRSSDSATNPSQSQKAGESTSQVDSQEAADSGYGSTELAPDVDEPGCLGRSLPGTDLKQYDQEIPTRLRDRFYDIRYTYNPFLVDAILKKRRKGADVGIKLKYLGTSSQNTELYIVFQCEKKTAKIVRKFFKQPHIEEEIRPDFKILVLEQELMRLADDDEIEVRARLTPAQTWCGTAITMSTQKGNAVSATLGGIITVEEANGDVEWYAITAAHALSKLYKTGLPTPDPSDSDQDSASDSDLSSNSDHDPLFQIAEETESNTSKEHHKVPHSGNTIWVAEPPSSPIHDDQSRIEVNKPQVIGHVLHHTSSCSEQNFHDWALIELDDIEVRPNLITSKAGTVTPDTPSIQLPEHQPQKYSSISVLVLTSHGPQAGILTFNTSSTMISPGQRFAETHDLMMDVGMSLNLGDSGSWVIDQRSGTAHGFVVSIDAFGEAQVMPLVPVLAEIQSILNAQTVWLPSLQVIEPPRRQKIKRRSPSSANPRIAKNALQPRSKSDYISCIDQISRSCLKLYIFFKPSEHERNYLERQKIATSLRQLHISFRHLRAEVDDPDSPLHNIPTGSSQDVQLSAILKKCSNDIIVQESLFEISRDWSKGMRHSPDAAEMRMMANINLIKADVENFLDSVQLHSDQKPSTANVVKPGLGIEHIKDKVDAIATRVFAWKDSGVYEESGDADWSAFKYELEKEGFSPQVLRRHQGVLRAYIREVDAIAQQNGGKPPTLRGVLKHDAHTTSSSREARSARPSITVSNNNQTRSTIGSATMSQTTHPTSMTDETRSIDSAEPESIGDLIALISTEDLIALDRRNLAQITRRRSAYSSLVSKFPVPVLGREFKLAPDEKGNEISMDAHWTKIHRSLISVEVLDQIGVRYEARPDYVAILGRLTREQTANYARQSASMRFSRSMRYSQALGYDKYSLGGWQLGSRETEDDSHGSLVWDSSDSEDVQDSSLSPGDTGSYPYIVIPPAKNSTKPPATDVVSPKPILKSKTENNVRFDTDYREPQATSAPRTPGSKQEDLQKRENVHELPKSRRWRERDIGTSEPEPRNRDRDRDRDSDQHRDRNDRYTRQSRRNKEKPVRGETLGIGGAAASLLSVLAEAASGV